MRPISSPGTGPAPRGRSRTVPVLGLALLATAAVAAAPAGAATPRFATIDQPLTTATSALAAVGDGHVAWVAVEAPGAIDSPAASIPIFTDRGGVATRAGSLPVADGPFGLEVGTQRGGAPVAAAYEASAKAPVVRLVDLDSGATRSFPSTVRGLRVGGVAIEDGRILYTLHPARFGSRSTSTLWSAPLSGLRAGPATRLRTSERGESWDGILADRGRVAIRTTHTGASGPVEQIAFGTPRGTWNRLPGVRIAPGARLVAAVGFTQDGRALASLRSTAAGALRATLTPIAPGGTRRHALLSSTGGTPITGAAFVPASGRFFGTGPSGGVLKTGYTAPVFVPAPAATR